MPRGELVLSEALPILDGKKVTSKGELKPRLRLSDLKGDEYQIATESDRCGTESVWFSVMIRGRECAVQMNANSLRKRLNCPLQAVRMFSQLDRLDLLIEPLLLKQLIQIARDSGIVQRFSKHDPRFNLQKSITISPTGFVAIDEAKKMAGKGGNARVKLCRGLHGEEMVRRISLHDDENDGLNRRLEQTFKLFENTPGVLDTHAALRYRNKKGKVIFVSYHPRYEMDLFHVLKGHLPFAMAKQISFNLVQGLALIARKGYHGDLKPENILVKFGTPVEAVICDFDFFNGGYAQNHCWTPPEFLLEHPQVPEANRKMDIWTLGCTLHALLQHPKHSTYSEIYSIFDKEGVLNMSMKKFFTQERIDRKIEKTIDCSSIALLLKGMLRVNPRERWDAQRVLEYWFQHQAEFV
jgi:serine/threonine protein kinase